jgi:tripartite-type tricarboxylate transporter receptor subunit TctC
MTVTRRQALRGLAMGSAAVWCAPAFAQDYPSRPLRLVVPFPAGGAIDVVARLLAEPMARHLNQTIVIENAAGAGGNIGAGLVARSAPDGYTLLAGLNSVFTLNPHLYTNMAFDPLSDLAPVTQTVSAHLALVVNPQLPVQSFSEFIAYAKAHPGKINFSSNGNGSAGHITGEMLKRAAGIDMVHVAYRGAAPALNDVIAGHVQATFDPLVTALPQIQAATVRPLAVASLKRIATLPDVPAIAETFAGFDTSGWQGLFVRAGTPAGIVSKLHAAAVAALGTDAVRERLRAFQFDPVGNTPADFSASIKVEHERWGKVIKDAGIRLAQ